MTLEQEQTRGFASPDSPHYVEATAAFILGTALAPRSAMVAREVDDVRRAVRETADAGERLIPMTTGHAAPSMTTSREVRLVRTDLEGDIVVDTERETVTFPAGTQWRAVATAVAEHGFAVPHGSSGTVGAAGYLLGGGMSFFGRAWGVAANHVESFAIVLADGEEHTVDADHDPELFWALRGGGGGFGVVTSVTVRLHRMRQLVTGMAAWRAEHARAIFDAWHEWTRTAPESATTSLRLLRLPPLPGVPPQLTEGQVIAVDGAVIPLEGGDIEAAERDADALLSRLRAIAEPVLDTWHTGPVTDLLATHGDPEDPVPGAVTDSFTIADFDDDAAAAWFELSGPDAGGTLANSEIRQLGGAFRDPAAAGGAFDRIDADVLVFTADIVMDPSRASEVERAVLDVRERMARWVGRWTSPTLHDNPATPHRAFSEQLQSRVEMVRRRVDPAGLFSLDVRHPLDAE